MPASDFDMNELHWMMDMFNTVDVGLIVLDRDYKVCIWNGFMENHSGLLPSAVKDKIVFDLFPSLDEQWFRSKTEAVFVLKNRSFTIWEQQPYIFKFRNYRPITGKADHMYQNATFIPLTNIRSEVTHVCIILYDVTDEAVNKLELEEANKKLEQLSRTDALTGLYNRGFWEENFKREFKRVKRAGGPTCLLMFDIDHFKHINDSFGHATGDEALREIAKLLKANLRESDVAGRYGGEEFAVTLVDTDLDGAKVYAERLRQSIEKAIIKHDEVELQLTVSIGIALCEEHFTRFEQWLESADKALYKSKSNGRNQVNVYQK